MSSQALGSHKNYCRYLKERPAPTVQPAAPAIPAAPRVPASSAEKAMPRGKKWDVGWSDVEKERYLLENSAFDWGIGRDRHGRWRVVPVAGGMSYSAAVIAADERNAIDRLFPVRRRGRAEVEDEEELVNVMLLLELIK